MRRALDTPGQLRCDDDTVLRQNDEALDTSTNNYFGLQIRKRAAVWFVTLILISFKQMRRDNTTLDVREL